jgi:ligand-binding SRPBCC domain-containing protein
MPHITLTTSIQAPAERCFDLSRSIDLHMISIRNTGEQAVGGKTSGLIGPGESVRWRARHFGIWQTLTSKITEYNRPRYFVDEMVQGAFASFRHEHLFLEKEGSTQMVDVFVYRAPLGVLGKLADALFLKAYMRRLLEERNRVIKEFAESDKWREVL